MKPTPPLFALVILVLASLAACGGSPSATATPRPLVVRKTPATLAVVRPVTTWPGTPPQAVATPAVPTEGAKGSTTQTAVPTNTPAASRSGAVSVPLAPRAGAGARPPTAADSDCSCDRNTLNCDDFPSDGWEAQACYERCLAFTGRDVHDLDRDHDGDACEWTWSR